jgi:hypothetical protein
MPEIPICALVSLFEKVFLAVRYLLPSRDGTPSMKGVRRPNFERKEIAKMKKWKTGRKRSLLSIALFIALSVVASSRVTAQVECLGRCEAQFAGCLININSGPVSLLQATCLESYEACVDACLGGSAAVLG